MTITKLAIAASCAACAAPAVDMQLQYAADDMTDVSCVTAVEVRAIGMRYAQDPRDAVTSCIPMAGPHYSDLQAKMRDQYTLSIPADGLAGVELRAWAGPNACDPMSFQPFFTPDLVFYASSEYIGQDTVTLPITQNLGCTRANLTIHVTDVMGMLAGATPTDANCTTATKVTDSSPSNQTSGVGRGTFVAEPFAQSAQYYGGNDGAGWTAGVAKFPGFTTAGPKSCAVLDGANDTGGSTSCQIDRPVCAGSATVGELELAAVPAAINSAVMQLRPDLLAKFPGIVVGSVWTSGAPKHPASGATATIDPAHGEVVYIDAPTTGTATPVSRADQSATGAGGLFLLYTNTVGPVTINVGGQSRTVTLGATANSNAAALIQVP